MGAAQRVILEARFEKDFAYPRGCIWVYGAQQLTFSAFYIYLQDVYLAVASEYVAENIIFIERSHRYCSCALRPDATIAASFFPTEVYNSIARPDGPLSEAKATLETIEVTLHTLYVLRKRLKSEHIALPAARQEICGTDSDVAAEVHEDVVSTITTVVFAAENLVDRKKVIWTEGG